MRLITGDECGLLKVIIPERSSNPKNKDRDYDEEESHATPHNAMPHVALDGVKVIDSKESQSRSRAVIDMAYTSEEELSFATLRKNGSVQVWEQNADSKKTFGKYRKLLETKCIFKSVTDEAIRNAWKPLALGAFSKDARLCAGDSFGNLSVVNMENGNVIQTYNAYKTSKGRATISYTPGNNLNTQLATSMAYDLRNGWVACGGRERETIVVDLATGNVVFKAKNLPPHPQTLLQYPVWPTAIAFLNDGKTMAVGTAYKELRLYDVRESSTTRRPIARSTTEGGPIEYRVTSLCQVSDYELAVGDAAGFIYSIDTRTLGKSNINNINSNNMGRYVGPAGSVRQLKKHPTLPRMAAVGLDRMLRVYDTTNRKQLDCFYMKQRLNCVLFGKDDDWRPGSSTTGDAKLDDDQDIDQDDIVQDYIDSDEESENSEGRRENELADREASSSSDEASETMVSDSGDVSTERPQTNTYTSDDGEASNTSDNDDINNGTEESSVESSEKDGSDEEEIIIRTPIKKKQKRKA